MGTLQKINSLPFSAKLDLPDAFFVTGTDTGVGKTFVSAVMAAGLLGGYWKPIQAGLDPMTDTQWVRENSGLPDNHFFPEAYRLSRPLSPHAAAHHDQIRIDMNKINLPDRGDLPYIIVEGAGGILVPLNHKELMIDLIDHLNLPVLLVARSGLGTINHTLLSIQALRHRSIPLIGVVMNGRKNPSNRDAIELYGRAPVIAEIDLVTRISPNILAKIYEDSFGDEA